MNETKQCNKGHFYREELEKCPFCSDKKVQEDSIEITKLNNSSEKDSLKTKLNKTNNIKEILNPYFTTKKDGTGLGLSIVNKIINDHNGNIEFLSKVDGAIIKITFIKFFYDILNNMLIYKKEK